MGSQSVNDIQIDLTSATLPKPLGSRQICSIYWPSSLRTIQISPQHEFCPDAAVWNEGSSLFFEFIFSFRQGAHVRILILPLAYINISIQVDPHLKHPDLDAYPLSYIYFTAYSLLPTPSFSLKQQRKEYYYTLDSYYALWSPLTLRFSNDLNQV